jgi:hypothetical protein
MAEAVKADLSTQDGVEELWNRVEWMGRPVDAIAINAGVGVGRPTWKRTSMRRSISST